MSDSSAAAKTQCQTRGVAAADCRPRHCWLPLQINGMQAGSIVGRSGRDAQVNAEKTRGKEWAITAHCVNTVRPRAHTRGLKIAHATCARTYVEWAHLFSFAFLHFTSRNNKTCMALFATLSPLCPHFLHTHPPSPFPNMY